MFRFLWEKIAQRIHGWGHRHLSFGGRLTLIKSTLKALPLHIFQALEPTAGSINLLEQQLARFFWGSVRDQKRTHWISWEQICLPTAEGGLGIRNFQDVVKAFSLKLWWRFREQNSLWATHMFKKYCTTRSPLENFAPSNGSFVWRRLIQNWAETHQHTRWMIGDGSTFFWDDIWLGDRKIRSLCLDERGPPLTRVADLWENFQWSVPKLQMLHDQAGLPQDTMADILETPIIQGGRDLPRWSLTPHGNFSISSAWEACRQRRPEILLLGEIWNKGFSASMSIFLWRLLSNRIPVDSKLQWRQISLASKCTCCTSHPNIESVEHLFIRGEGATKVWNEFNLWFPGSPSRLSSSDSLPDRMMTWSRRTHQKDVNHLCRIIPGIILWFIWAERNNSRHNDERFRAQNISWQVKRHLHNIMANGAIDPAHCEGCDLPLELTVQISRNRLPGRPPPVKWIPPDEGWFKLNTSGIFDGQLNRGCGGGILRDHLGDLISAFSSSFPATTLLEVGLLSIIHGLEFSPSVYRPIFVETDSVHLISLLDKGNLGPASCRHLVARITILKQKTHCVFRYVRRAGNKTARALTKNRPVGLQTRSFDYLSAPPELKAMVRLEKLGLPNFDVEDEAPD